MEQDNIIKLLRTLWEQLCKSGKIISWKKNFNPDTPLADIGLNRKSLALLIKCSLHAYNEKINENQALAASQELAKLFNNSTKPKTVQNLINSLNAYFATHPCDEVHKITILPAEK